MNRVTIMYSFCSYEVLKNWSIHVGSFPINLLGWGISSSKFLLRDLGKV